MLALTVAPFVFAREMNARAHASLSVLLLGVCAAFVYGVGFEPSRKAWRIAWPVFVWGILALGMLMIALWR